MTVNLPVNLAGHPALWRFPGSPMLEELFAAAPWSNGGGVRIVRTVRGYGRAVADMLGREARVAEGGLLDLRVLTIPPERLTAGLEVALEGLRRPGIDPAPAGPERTDYLADWLTDQPTVLLIGPAPAGLAPGVLADVRDLYDWTLKKNSRLAVTALVLDTPEERAGGSHIDLTVGWPVDSTLPAYSDGVGRLWRAYLHARVAWETAGDLSCATCWSEGGFSNLADEEDVGCERLLNQLAAADLRKAGSGTRKKLIEFVSAFLHPARSRGDLLRRADDLLQAGVIWKPDGSGWPQPVPWAARALLSSNAVPDAESLLRGCLICRPLAREIQGRCLDLESRERAVCWVLKTRWAPHPEAVKRWQDYSTDPAHHARVFYPPDCPAEPADSWPFTTFGEFLHATSPNSLQWNVWHELRELRNGLAHNHYLCWRVLMRLIDIEARLDP